ncbi:transposon ty3-i Gag-Pol polyprotein [Plakobranchus ocellatus]|uniref:Transposon ty3-i Gag-Pol polyprotein n=1 Tax=Plakobranchus ocellatus TaxID=259542 RepID=A0AAV3ZNZ6_9GAST|nr:transposon ty3-i Gag-Pol polyprotein [Plakobranchus ocellatus]
MWNRYINPLLFAYREVLARLNTFAPFELLYMRTIRGPMHIVRELWMNGIQEQMGKGSTTPCRLLVKSETSGCLGLATLKKHCIEPQFLIPVQQRPYPVACSIALSNPLYRVLCAMSFTDGEFGNHQEDQFSLRIPVAVVKKKDGSNRVCIDFTWLKKLTVFDPQPIKSPADVFQGMENDRFFPKMDMSKGY